MGESTHEHATDNLTLFSPFASKIHIKPKFNLSGILPWLNNNFKFYLIVEVLLRETAQKMSVWERLFWVRKEIFSDSEKSFMAQKTFPKSVENSFIKTNSYKLCVV